MRGERAGDEPLDRFLARRLRWAWAAVRRAIHAGRVEVGGVACRHYHRRLLPSDAVVIDGRPVARHDGDAGMGEPDTDDATLVCHKPAGVACSHDPRDAPLLDALVPERWRHPDLHSAGRLDRDTTGLIVLTIDGQLIEAITAPAAHRWKRYDLGWAGRLAADAAHQVAVGLLLSGDAGAEPAGTDAPGAPERCRPARLVVSGRERTGGTATIWLQEGKHHQVKRMLRTLGGEVVWLHRSAVGGLLLPADLAPGAMRPVSAPELAALLAPGDPAADDSREDPVKGEG